jgi:mono/diheme cytochrome c family protein
MKKLKIISITMLLMASSAALASGTHGSGHSMEGMKSSMPGMKAGGHWASPAAEAARDNPVAFNSSSVKKGAGLYQQYCASCHGVKADGKGPAGMMLNPPPADLTAMSGGHSDGDFAYKINTGRGAMPSWKGTLNETQVWQLVNFIQSLSKGTVANDEQHGHEAGHGHDS